MTGPVEPQVAFGRAVHARRRRLGLSREELAARLGWALSSIGRVERGDHSPSLDRLWQLAAGLRLPLSELVVDAETRMRKDQP